LELTALWLIGVLLAVLGFAGSFSLGLLFTRLNKMEDALNTLHLIYAKKEDVTRDFQQIQDTLQRIEDKLDRKQDR